MARTKFYEPPKMVEKTERILTLRPLCSGYGGFHNLIVDHESDTHWYGRRLEKETAHIGLQKWVFKITRERTRTVMVPA